MTTDETTVPDLDAPLGTLARRRAAVELPAGRAILREQIGESSDAMPGLLGLALDYIDRLERTQPFADCPKIGDIFPDDTDAG